MMLEVFLLLGLLLTCKSQTSFDFVLVNNSFVNWFEASSSCLSLQRYLVTLDTVDKYNFLFSSINFDEYDTAFWIGLVSANIFYFPFIFCTSKQHILGFE